jgi:hypothetical protein
MGAPEWIARFQGMLARAVQLQTSLVHGAQRLPGFQFDETMTGTVSLSGADLPLGERRMVLRLRAQVGHLGDYLQDGRTELSGTASIDGFVDAAPVSGSLFIWPHRRVIRYELEFSAGDRSLRLAGQKDVRLLDFRRTMTTLPAKLYDAHGAEVGHATVSFDWADLPAFLLSFRPVATTDGDGDGVSARSGGFA